MVESRQGERAYWKRVDTLIELALEEDLPGGDVTTEALVDESAAADGFIIAREDLTVSGLAVAQRVFRRLDGNVTWKAVAEDGQAVGGGSVLATLSGLARPMLAGERTALNFLQHLSGIATTTARVMACAGGGDVAILDTRKTLPAWRLLEKKAVRDGGGRNHRTSLSDSVLIKDNHITLTGSPAAAVTRARRKMPAGTVIEVEVENAADLEEVIAAGADIVLYDNADIPGLAEAVRVARDRKVLIEASGGISAGNVAAVAATGVDRISMGMLTHSAPSVDISFDLGIPPT